MKFFTTKAARFLIIIVFGIIAISFILPGYKRSDFFGGAGHGDSVASVDGTTVSAREYQGLLSRQLEFYGQITGGSLSTKQIEDMKIKENVLNILINQKILLNFVSKIGISASQDEIRAEIKKIPAFLSNNQFDVERYKAVLNQNSYTPQTFETLITDEIKGKQAEKIFSFQNLSKSYINDLTKLKNALLNATAVKIIKKELAKFIKVEQTEIDKFVSDANNKKKIEEAYQQNFSKYNQEEELKARHILIKAKEKETDTDLAKRVSDIAKNINAKNFKVEANKLTEDPSGKTNGGELGWFAKGRMVKEFEEVAFKLKPGVVSQPVKTQFGYHIIMVDDKKAAKTISMDLATSELAKDLLQELKTAELEKLTEEVTNKVKAALESNDLKTLEATVKQYNLAFENNKPFNILDGQIGEILLAQDEVSELYKTKNAPSVQIFKNVTGAIVAKTTQSGTSAQVDEKTLAETLNSEKGKLSSKLRQEIIDDMNKNSKIVTYPSMM